MNQKPMKLGVLALLLLVISVCLTVMTVLTLSTAQADLRLSQRFAEMTRQQYRRESAGQAFLQEADRALEQGSSLTQLEGVTREGNVYEKTVAEGNAVLTIGLRLTGKDSYEIVYWKTSTQWLPEKSTGDLWGG